MPECTVQVALAGVSREARCRGGGGGQREGPLGGPHQEVGGQMALAERCERVTGQTQWKERVTLMEQPNLKTFEGTRSASTSVLRRASWHCGCQGWAGLGR